MGSLLKGPEVVNFAMTVSVHLAMSHFLLVIWAISLHRQSACSASFNAGP